MDKNYLFLAEKLGVSILSEHEVEDIVPLVDGGYQLSLRKSLMEHPLLQLLNQ